MALKFLLNNKNNEENEEIVQQPVVQQQPQRRRGRRRGGRRLNTAQAEERMVRVFEMLLYEKLNYTEFKIKASREFEISQRAAENLWADARETLKQKFNQEKDAIIIEQLERYFNLLRRAKQDGNKRVENDILKDLTKLYQLDTKHIDITSAGNPISININLTED